jgi:serine/threonine protein phosphatase PrpC
VIIDQVCEKGGRIDNLDLLVPLIGGGGWQGVLLFDGYKCSEGSVRELARRMVAAFEGNSGVDAQGLIRLVDVAGLSVNASVLVLVRQGKSVTIFSSGDCRAYSLELGLLTSDHSVAWEQLAGRGITASKVSSLVVKHPARRVLTKSFKSPAGVVDGGLISLSTHDVSMLLICSDGFWEHLEEAVVVKLLNRDLSLEDFSASLPDSAENRTACIINFD